MAAKVICSECRAILSVRDDAPERLICCRCLTRLINPYARPKGKPVPAIPIEQELSKDLQQTRRMMTFFAAGLILSGFVILGSAPQVGDVAGILMVIVGILTGIASNLLGKIHRKTPTTDATSALATPSDDATAAQPSTNQTMPATVLDYQTPIDRGEYAGIGSSGAGCFTFIAGFGLQFAVGVTASFLGENLSGTSQENFRSFLTLWCLGFVACLLIGFWSGTKRDRWGFFGGTLAGVAFTGGLCGLLYALCGNSRL